jgi:hypothetical protein
MGVRVMSLLMIVGLLAAAVDAQQRALSPRGTASMQIGGRWLAEKSPDTAGGRRYAGGKWIEVEYGRPLLRGRRNLFGSGKDYGKAFLIGAPVWRIGADQSTTFRTEADLMFGGKRLPAGAYTMFAELRESEWTLIFSSYTAIQSYDKRTPSALWGAYEYKPERDVVRTAMRVTKHPVSADQLTIMFTDVTDQAGTLAIWWDDQMATAPFTLAK